MKCEVCGSSIIINWGSDSVTVCEDHTGHIDELGKQKAKAAKQWTEGVRRQRPVPVKVTASFSVLLPFWWALTWRFMFMSIVFGMMFASQLLYFLRGWVEKELLTLSVAEDIAILFYLVMAAIFIFISLGLVVGKRLGIFRLIIVRTDDSESEARREHM